MSSEARSGRPLSPIDTVCLGLNMMAGGHFQRVGAIVGGISQSAACRAINRSYLHIYRYFMSDNGTIVFYHLRSFRTFDSVDTVVEFHPVDNIKLT